MEKKCIVKIKMDNKEFYTPMIIVPFRNLLQLLELKYLKTLGFKREIKRFLVFTKWCKKMDILMEDLNQNAQFEKKNYNIM